MASRILPNKDQLGSHISVVTHIGSGLHQLYHSIDGRGNEKQKKNQGLLTPVTMRTLKKLVCYEVILMNFRTG